MKFTAVVGNPPYQEGVDGNTRDTPIYNYFIDVSQQISDLVCLIHPARFLFNAGQTPKDWNNKILNDPYFSVIYYEEKSSILFPNTDIKGGVCVSLWDKKSKHGGLGGKFLHFPKLEGILNKIKNGGFNTIVFANTIPRKPLNPKRPNDKKIRTNAFAELPEIFLKEPNKENTVEIIGLLKNTRTIRYTSIDNLEDPLLNKWKLFLSKSN